MTPTERAVDEDDEPHAPDRMNIKEMGFLSRLASDRTALATYNEMLTRLAGQSTKPKHVPDVGSVHEVLYRAVSGLMWSNQSITHGLAGAQLLLDPLFAWEFPREHRTQFLHIQQTPKGCDAETADRMARSLVDLYLKLAEQVIGPASLLNFYEQSAWCVMQAKEGRPEPLRRLIHEHRQRGKPLPECITTYQADVARQRAIKGVTRRRGRPSQHPAQTIAIARLVRDAYEAQTCHYTDRKRLDLATRHDQPSVRKAVAQVAAFVGTYATTMTAYASVYGKSFSKRHFST